MAAYFYPLLTDVCLTHIHFAFNGHAMVIWQTLHPLCSLLVVPQVYPTVSQAPAREKHGFSITVHPFSIDEGRDVHSNTRGL